MSFKEYLKTELEKPVSHDSYDPNGNSTRAVVVRGFIGEVVWQYKRFPKRLLSLLKDFDGLSTELGWFLQVPFMVILSPVLPVTAAYYWYKKSIGVYKGLYIVSQQVS